MAFPPNAPMMSEADLFQSRIILNNLKTHRGKKAIANFLNVDERTVQNYLGSGKWPIKRDPSGKLVLCEVDYYLSLDANGKP